MTTHRCTHWKPTHVFCCTAALGKTRRHTINPQSTGLLLSFCQWASPIRKCGGPVWPWPLICARNGVSATRAKGNIPPDNFKLYTSHGGSKNWSWGPHHSHSSRPSLFPSYPLPSRHLFLTFVSPFPLLSLSLSLPPLAILYPSPLVQLWTGGAPAPNAFWPSWLQKTRLMTTDLVLFPADALSTLTDRMEVTGRLSPRSATSVLDL